MHSQSLSSRQTWTPWVLAIVGFWLSSNLVLDFLVMPVMSLSGMTTQSGFAAAGYSLFWSFNHLELVAAAVILTGLLALNHRPTEFEVAQGGSRSRWALLLGLGLFCFALVDTYLLTPEMSAMALSLDSFTSTTAITPAMNWMHSVYWLLDVFKVVSLAYLGRLCLADLRDRDFSASKILA